MKQRILLGLMVVFGLNLVAQEKVNPPVAPEKVNPVMEKHADDISFCVNFDDENPEAVLAGGGKTIRSVAVKPAFVPGLFGKAMQFGSVSYHGAGNLDFTKPGTIIYWMAPQNWKQIEKEPYIVPFMAHNDESKILIGRQGDVWGRSRIYAFVEAVDRKNNVYNGLNGASGRDWKNGEWRMIAVTWTPETIGLSVNGTPLQEANLKQPISKSNNGWFSFTACDREDHQILLDELVVLSRKLTNEELKSLYDETMKRVKK